MAQFIVLYPIKHGCQNHSTGAVQNQKAVTAYFSSERLMFSALWDSTVKQDQKAVTASL